MTFSPNKSLSVCMIINWGPEDLGQPAPLLPEEIVPLPTPNLLPALAGSRQLQALGWEVLGTAGG